MISISIDLAFSDNDEKTEMIKMIKRINLATVDYLEINNVGVYNWNKYELTDNTICVYKDNDLLLHISIKHIETIVLYITCQEKKRIEVIK